VFVDGYRPGVTMGKHPAAAFRLLLPGGTTSVPEVRTRDFYFCPFNFDLGFTKILHATAQPICKIQTGNRTTYFFDNLGGVPQMSIPNLGFEVVRCSGEKLMAQGAFEFRFPHPGLDDALVLRGTNGQEAAIVILSPQQSREIWKGELSGAERVVVSDRNLVFDGQKLRILDERPGGIVSIFPAPPSISVGSAKLQSATDGLFQTYAIPSSPTEGATVLVEPGRKAGPARTIANGKAGVAEQPTDLDFEKAATWRIKLPHNVRNKAGWMLQIPYVGDVARIYLDGKLIEDNFFNGSAMELGLDRFGPAIWIGDLELKVLPLRDDAPIMIPNDPRPFGAGESGYVHLGEIRMVQTRDVSLDVSE
jgi:beta-galactosidase